MLVLNAFVVVFGEQKYGYGALITKTILLTLGNAEISLSVGTSPVVGGKTWYVYDHIPIF